MAHTTTPQFDHVNESECGDTSYDTRDISYTYASSTNITCSDEETLVSTAQSVESHREVPTFPLGLKAECAEIKDSSDFGEIVSEEQSPTSMQRKKSPDCISIFLDTECGEPLTSQHLRVDFTTIQGVDDTEFLRKKCADFWKLVEGSSKLQELKRVVEVVPDLEKSSSQSLVTEQGDHALANHGVIDIIQRKGRMVDDCFMNKMKTRYCEVGSGDYFADSPQAKPDAIRSWRSARRTSRLHSRPHEDVTKLCTELEQWDLNHPKSMEPPNHGPPHTYALLERN